ncbi:pilus assembly protein CpaF [Jatrophihabitans sp. GAS493]|uniref:CpaF family protein n=1 Tax=Jatrophihabitans sp. GAS493 TaxID=1907575 RepID=UPI000BB6984C|nr:ATPase, T2SS/T4P/T4SS family [Jatrophihabitans sp. GAS493]SOD73063.1 pilus assembly protein CpaF [Jatrophihabitans sp. GAS493]
MASGQSIVEDEVRELIQRRGIDPIVEPATTRRLVEEVIGEYLDRSVTSSLPPLGDPAALLRAVLDSVSGFGPLQPFLDDRTVEEIWINEPGRVFIARRGRSELTTLILSTEQVAELVERMLRASGRRLDLSSPFVDAMLPDGSRLHVVIPQITRTHMAVNIRKFIRGISTLDELIALNALPAAAARFLEASVVAGLNILVSGGTQAGKTTLLNALCAAIPARERVITVEEVFELQLGLPDVVSMQTRQANLEGTGEIPLRRLVKEALRMRPSRLVVGEVRQEECLDLLIALNSGLPGMCTLHANSAREALVKMCTLPLLAGENVSGAFVLPTVATSVDLVVHLGSEASGHRRVREIVAVPGRIEGDTIETADIFTSVRGRLERGDGYPPHLQRFEQAGVDVAELLGSAGRHSTARSLAERVS